LATNAAKYGALTAGAGRVELSWTAADGRLALTWAEQGGPPVQAAPSRKGFGSRLIAKLAAGDLGGTLEAAYPPEGFRLNLSVPLQAP
jgi:two-component sensor histidine kinase